MSYATLEVDLRDGHVVPRSGETLPATAHALLVVLDTNPPPRAGNSPDVSQALAGIRGRQAARGHAPRSCDAIARQVPVYAECGGLMYLGQSLSDLEGVHYPMIGAIPVVSSMAGRRLTLGYREVESCTEGPLLRQGQRVRGHEFHWSVVGQPPDPEQAVYRVVDQEGRPEGFQVGSVWASYIHVHLGSHPSLARRFVDTCAAPQRAGSKASSRRRVNP